MSNIFSAARQLLATKPGHQMTEDELQFVATTIVLLAVSPYANMPIDQGLAHAAQDLEYAHESKQEGES